MDECMDPGNKELGSRPWDNKALVDKMEIVVEMDDNMVYKDLESTDSALVDMDKALDSMSWAETHHIDPVEKIRVLRDRNQCIMMHAKCETYASITSTTSTTRHFAE
jgi:hypothetical protein